MMCGLEQIEPLLLYVFFGANNPMSFKITGRTIGAFGSVVCALVATLDQHPMGAAFLLALVLVAAIAFAIVVIANKWKGNGDTVSPAPAHKKPQRRKAS